MAKVKQGENANVKAAVHFGGWFHSQTSDHRLDDSVLLRAFRESPDASSETGCTQSKPAEPKNNSSGNE